MYVSAPPPFPLTPKMMWRTQNIVKTYSLRTPEVSLECIRNNPTKGCHDYYIRTHEVSKELL